MQPKRKIARLRRRSDRRIARWRKRFDSRVANERTRRRQRIAKIRHRAQEAALVPAEAVEFVSRWEGWLGTAYQDVGGVWTIGYGHTGDVRPGQTITHKEGMKLLAADLRGAAEAVDRLVKVPLGVHQRAALISFTFNCGAGALETSTLLKRVNAKAPAVEIREAFLMWVKVGGDVVQGLVNRRSAEADLFNR